jgi:hypothetical protein
VAFKIHGVSYKTCLIHVPTTVSFESRVRFTYSWCCYGLIINSGVSSIKARYQEISEITVSLMGLLLVNTVYAGVGDKQCTGPYIVYIIN